MGLARFEHGRFTAFTTRDGLPHDRVNALWPDQQGDSADELWVGTAGGLCRFTRDRCIAYDGPVQALSHGSVTALHEDRQHNLWVGTSGNGLLLLRNGDVAQYTARDGLPSDTILALYQDPEGDIWVGTVDGGLCQLREGRFTVYTTGGRPAARFRDRRVRGFTRKSLDPHQRRAGPTQRRQDHRLAGQAGAA